MINEKKDVYSIKCMLEMVDKSSDIKKEELLWMYIGNMLDYFYSENRTEVERVELLLEEPLDLVNINNKWKSFLASTAGYISDIYDLEYPEWILSPKLQLENPMFDNNAKGLYRMVLICETPTWFFRNNIFMPENILSRV